MKWKHRHTVFLFVALGLSVGAYWPGRWIGYTAQVGLYSTLVTIAGIIFAVVGAWIALLYPKALSSVLEPRLGQPASEEERRVRVLLHPMRIVTVVLTAAMLFGPIAAMIQTSRPPDPWGFRLLGVSFSILVFLSQSLAWAALLTLLGPHYVEGDLDKKHDQQGAVERLRIVG